MMTDEHRQLMPILTLPAHQVELDLARYYLDDERVSAFNICAAMTQDVRTKHRKAREKLLQDEQTGKAILDRRDPYQVVPAAPWHIAFRFIGDNPNVLQASLQWGEMLNVARMGFVMAKDGISPKCNGILSCTLGMEQVRARTSDPGSRSVRLQATVVQKRRPARICR